MQNLEERIEKLEKQSIGNRLLTTLVNVELHIYKAEICRGRWGSPGGIDIGVLELAEARRILDYTPWPEELADSAKNANARIEKYAGYLKNKDITMVSYEDTRMKEAFKKLEEAVLEWVG
ncbi:MAG: hypothetical protein AAGU27_13230 [Dehalobacterium sp.]